MQLVRTVLNKLVIVLIGCNNWRAKYRISPFNLVRFVTDQECNIIACEISSLRKQHVMLTGADVLAGYG